MGFPHSVLAPGERLLAHHRPHVRVLVWPVATLLAGTFLLGLGAGAAQAHLDGTAESVVVLLVLALWSLVVYRKVVRRYARWLSTHLAVTDRRVVVREGVVRQRGMDLPANRISNVQYRQGPLERVLGCGTLVVVPVAQPPVEFPDTPHVQDVHRMLYGQVFDGALAPHRGR